MGLLIAAIVVVAGVIGTGAKEGAFRKGYDTTYADTLTFEKHALEQKLARTQEKKRAVVELTGDSSDAAERRASLTAKEKRIQAKIARIDGKLETTD